MTSLREEMSIANQKLQVDLSPNQSSLNLQSQGFLPLSFLDIICQMVESKVVQQQYEDAEKKVVMKDLQQRLADAELRVREGELLRRKLHNTILV